MEQQSLANKVIQGIKKKKSLEEVTRAFHSYDGFLNNLYELNKPYNVDLYIHVSELYENYKLTVI